MKELFVDYFNDNAIVRFWQEVVNTPDVFNVVIYINYETADLLAYSKEDQVLLVKMFADKACGEWTKLVDDNDISEKMFSDFMNGTIQDIIKILEVYKPFEIENVYYLSNWFGDLPYSYASTRIID